VSNVDDSEISACKLSAAAEPTREICVGLSVPLLGRTSVNKKGVAAVGLVLAAIVTTASFLYSFLYRSATDQIVAQGNSLPCPQETERIEPLNPNVEVATEPVERDDTDVEITRTPVTFGDYTFVARGGKGVYDLPDAIEVHRGSKLIISLPNKERSERFYVSFPLKAPPYHKPTIFTSKQQFHSLIWKYSQPEQNPLIDITGDGASDCIIRAFMGNAHGDSETFIYKFGRKARMIAKLSGSSEDFRFLDLDGDNKYETIGNDCTFANWRGALAESPSPRVILTPRHQKFEIDCKLMTMPPPNHSQFEAIVKECRGDITWTGNAFTLPASVTEQMLNLIYSGNSKYAWKLLDRMWPNQYPVVDESGWTKKQFKREFLAVLADSPYRDGIGKLNPKDSLLNGALSYRPRR